MILAETKTSQSSEEGSEITYELNKNPKKYRKTLKSTRVCQRNPKGVHIKKRTKKKAKQKSTVTKEKLVYRDEQRSKTSGGGIREIVRY